MKFPFSDNPWASVAETWHKNPPERYVLPEDADKFSLVNDKNLHLELPPQPFIGNPEAPIWILNICPSYSDLDRYDMCNADRAGLEYRFRFSGEDEQAQLAKRRELLFNQLAFKGKLPFYPLEARFNTIKHPGGHKLIGTYAWWNRTLIGNNLDNRFITSVAQASEKCFVLELFPYHYEGTPKPATIKCTAHFALWQKLIAYAQKEDKVFVVRETVAPWVTEITGTENNLIHFTSQNASLSHGNVAFFNRESARACRHIRASHMCAQARWMKAAKEVRRLA